MKLTFFSDYTLRILMFAALRGEEKFSVEEVAGSYGLSKHHTAKAVNFLTRTGYLASRRGRNGGIRLGREANEIAIGKLVRETEGRRQLMECFAPATNACPLIRACALKGALFQAESAFFGVLDKLTLADLVQNGAQLRRALEMAP